MVEEIFEEFGQKYDIHLIPSRGGVFEVTVDEKLIFSKSATDRHAVYETDVAPHLRA